MYQGLLAGVWLTATMAIAAEPVIRNPSFEADSIRSGMPDQWQVSGDARLVTQTLELDTGRDGQHCARLRCTRFEAGSPAAHAMLAQLGVPVRKGVTYRFSFWARAEGITADIVSLKLADTSTWDGCGLEDAFVPGGDWKQFEFVFRGTRDCREQTRLQIWFTSTGTLWIDDVAIEEVSSDLYRPGHIIAAMSGGNLIPNAGFECGAGGWGSAAWDATTHWGGNMNRLFGEVVSGDTVEGRACLKIEVSAASQPVSYFDYFEMHRTAIRAPLAGNLGYIAVDPQAEYAFSVHVRAAEPNTPVRLAVRYFGGGTTEKLVRASTEWQRFQLTFRPRTRWCYVLAGPDLRANGETPNPPSTATVWLDALQLGQASEAAAYKPRYPAELQLSTGKVGNVFDWSEPIVLQLHASKSEGNSMQDARIELRVEDFTSTEVWSTTLPFPAQDLTEINLGDRTELRGYLRARATMFVNGDPRYESSLRLASIPVHKDADSRFGVNHAYPWPHLLDLCRQAGLSWVRDWSLKWHDVEPEKGKFVFAETDLQINRPLRHGLQVLGLMPFPSANWSSSALDSVTSRGPYPQIRARVAYAPRDEREFADYVARMVSNYSDRVSWWQVFNEPLFTDYSLPRKHGYTGADYARWTKTFAHAARNADADCRVLAGIGYLGEGDILRDFEQFFAAGALAEIDAVDIHHYPRLRPPEFAEPLLQKLNALMDQHGGRKPIWLTEYGYYADDDPTTVPCRHSGFDQPLESEQVQAEYAVRWATIMFANGVDKIFYHAGTCDGLNDDSLQGIFFEYAGQPHKIFAAQAVMSRLFKPSCRFQRRLELGTGTWGYLFCDEAQWLAVIWTGRSIAPRPIAAEAGKQVWDIMGRTVPAERRVLSPSPVYILGTQQEMEALEQALK